jgi:hypothetical protein
MIEASHELQAPVTEDPWREHMLDGNFAAAWTVADAVLRERAHVPCWDRPRHEQYLWKGELLHGRRVMIHCYHGLGDTLQFIRYLPLVKAVAARTVVWAQPELIPLLRTARGIDELLPLADDWPKTDCDLHVELSELPHVFRTTLRTIPNNVPYLRAIPRLPRSARPGLNVGLVWAAGNWDASRNVPIELLTPLARIPGVTLHALQRGSALHDWRNAWSPISGRDNPAEAASVMRALDLIISVDSMPAHLAGALAVPVWTLLPARADWRWLRDREDSPWYPTMRLFRQRTADDWTDVIRHVAQELHALATARRLIH